jgi:hypothetical protein
VEHHRADLDSVARKLRMWTRTDLEIEFVQTSAFEKTATGKELMVVRKLPVTQVGDPL